MWPYLNKNNKDIAFENSHMPEVQVNIVQAASHLNLQSQGAYFLFKIIKIKYI